MLGYDINQLYMPWRDYSVLWIDVLTQMIATVVLSLNSSKTTSYVRI